ncbi:MAG: alpha/beta hydrolase [Lachnospiraceae bacterium]
MIVTTMKLYNDRDDVTLTTYLWNDSPEMLNKKSRPAVLICPGGAYLSCSDREGEPIALQFAAMGYHAFVLRYSVYGDFSVFEQGIDHMKTDPAKMHPAPMREIGMAIRQIREHSQEWFVDTEKIAICGFSAGGHNCAMYATNYHKPVVTEYLQMDAGDLRPAAVILGYPLTDYVFMKDSLKNTKDPMAKILFELSAFSFLGKTTPEEKLLTEISPARNVSEHTPPTFIWATAADSLVPIEHSVLMSYALAQCQVPFAIHIFEEGPHGLATATQSSAQAKSEINPQAAEWIGLCESWLRKRFALDLPEKSPWA